MKRLIIIGASGHGKVVADIAVKCGYDEIAFLDDDESLTECGKWKVIGKSSMASELDDDLFIAIGRAKTRRLLFERYPDKNIVTLVHPNAVVSESAVIGRGTVVMAGVVINADAKIGDGCIVNTCSSRLHG